MFHLSALRANTLLMVSLSTFIQLRYHNNLIIASKNLKKLFCILRLTSKLSAGAARGLDVKPFLHFFSKKTPRFRGVFYCYEVDNAHTGPQIIESLPHHQQYNGRELMQDSQGYLTPPTQNCQGYFISALSDAWSFVLWQRVKNLATTAKDSFKLGPVK